MCILLCVCVSVSFSVRFRLGSGTFGASACFLLFFRFFLFFIPFSYNSFVYTVPLFFACFHGLQGCLFPFSIHYWKHFPFCFHYRKWSVFRFFSVKRKLGACFPVFSLLPGNSHYPFYEKPYIQDLTLQPPGSLLTSSLFCH